MDPTGCFYDRSRRAAGLVELAIAAIGIGLEDSTVVDEMRLGMLSGAIARVIEHGAWRGLSTKRLVVAHIDPDPAGEGLAFGQDRYRGVVAMQALRAQHVGLEAFEQRRQCRRAAADLIG